MNDNQFGTQELNKAFESLVGLEKDLRERANKQANQELLKVADQLLSLIHADGAASNSEHNGMIAVELKALINSPQSKVLFSKSELADLREISKFYSRLNQGLSPKFKPRFFIWI